MFKTPPLTQSRMRLAIIFAVAADALQFALGPVGWVGAVQVIDVIAMVLTMMTIGFHFLLLPTFVIEFFPLLDMAPTWTGCVIAVIALRKRGETAPDESVPPRIPPTPPRLEDSPREIKDPTPPGF
jgi:hypothetical protein